jgi:hypothetical protein
MHIFKNVDFTAFEAAGIIYQHLVFLNKEAVNRESSIVNREWSHYDRRIFKAPLCFLRVTAPSWFNMKKPRFRRGSIRLFSRVTQPSKTGKEDIDNSPDKR